MSPYFGPPAADAERALLGPIRDPRKISEYGLVLRSLAVPHAVSAREDGWYFVVDAHRASRVREALEQYEVENRDWPPRPVRTKERLVAEGSLRLPFLWALALSVFFLVTGPVVERSTWFDAGTASSARIMHGEVWRAVTALTLHADGAHVIGNVFAGGTFLWAASRRLGEGRAIFYTTLAGTLGNLANAVAHRSHHLSIGASTAVFGTVGLLVATQFRSNREAGSRRWTDRIGPWMGGFALLGALGASPHSDLGAHGFGLLAGILIGLVIARAPKEGERASVWVQPLAFVGTAALLVGSWALALRFPR